MISAEPLIIEANIPESSILSAKKVTLRTVSDRNYDTIARVNGIQQAYYRLRFGSASIHTKYLRPGLNKITVKNNSHLPNIVNSLEFDVPNLASYLSGESINYEEQKAIVLDSNEFIWEDFTKPLQIDNFKIGRGQKATIQPPLHKIKQVKTQSSFRKPIPLTPMQLQSSSATKIIPTKTSHLLSMLTMMHPQLRTISLKLWATKMGI